MMTSLQQYKANQVEEKRDQDVFRAAVLDDKKKGVLKKGPYTLGFFGQVKALIVRQFQTRLQDSFQMRPSSGPLPSWNSWGLWATITNSPKTAIHHPSGSTHSPVLITLIIYHKTT